MDRAQIESTYRVEYVSETRSVLLHDLVTDSELLTMDYQQFQAHNKAVFGLQRARDIDIAVCGYRRVILSWATARVAVQRETIDPVGEFMRRAMSMEAIETEYVGIDSPDFDAQEFHDYLVHTAR